MRKHHSFFKEEVLRMDTSTSTNLLTLDQAAARLAMSTETVRRYARLGRIKACLIGGRYRIEPAFLDEYIRENRYSRQGIPA
jgi:excisionase family DNA binding protein